MDILLEGRQAAAATETDLRTAAATLDRSQARNFSIPLSLTLGRRRRGGNRKRDGRTGRTDSAAAAAGLACVNFTIVFRGG